ncbi:MAG TPA: hypothetical protein VFO10_26550 [Oligoflexus sp.]|uniref:hypothetical protein n=1 Tax=Oligoflexus sp. TaxID=1971216 RepID=UPI002D7E30E1|nr:hypothetical protein [Oligoflexus sp.]HET9240853.1 hypothetical protein [Oligoflexus sp.]
MKNFRGYAFVKSLLLVASVGFNGWALSQTTDGGTPVPALALSWEADIKPIVIDTCGGCHNAADASGGVILETQDQVVKLKSSIITVLNEGRMPLGDPGFGSSEEGKKFLEWLSAQPDPVSYYDSTIKPIITANCLKCHTRTKAKGGYAFDTQAQVEAARRIIASEVSRGSMPQGNRNFKNSPEAKLLLNWIKALETSPGS